MADGSRHKLYLVAESTWGTTPTTPAFLNVRHTGCTIGTEKDLLESDELRSDRMVVGSRLGQNQVGGKISMEASNDNQFESLLEAAMCDTWTTNGLKVGVTRKPFSILRIFDDMVAGQRKNMLTTGCEIAGFDLKVGTNAIAKIDFDVVGSVQTISASAPVGATFGSPSNVRSMDGFTGAIEFDDTSIAVVTEVNLRLDNNVDRRFVIGSRDSIRPTLGKSKATGSFTAFFEDDLALAKFMAGTTTQFKFTLTMGSDTLTFEMTNILITGAKPDVTSDKAILITLPFEALYDSATGTTITITRTA